MRSDANAYDAAVLLFTEDVGTVFVGEENDLIGIVSRKDLLKAAMGREDLQKIPISMVMTPKSKMIYAELNEDMVSVAQKLIDYEIDCLPVVTAAERNGEKCYILHGRISKPILLVCSWNWDLATGGNICYEKKCRQFMLYPTLWERRQKVLQKQL